jgi:inner membrane protein involved in colicin E2 resistance
VHLLAFATPQVAIAASSLMAIFIFTIKDSERTSWLQYLVVDIAPVDTGIAN